MTHNGGRTIREREMGIVRFVPQREKKRGKEALEDVDDENRSRSTPAEHAKRVRRAEIAAAFLAEIDAARAPDDVARGDRAGEVGGEQEQNDCGHSGNMRI